MSANQDQIPTKKNKKKLYLVKPVAIFGLTDDQVLQLGVLHPDVVLGLHPGLEAQGLVIDLKRFNSLSVKVRLD